MERAVDFDLKEERREQASLWLGFLSLLTLITLITVVNMQKEYRYYHTGEMVVGQFTSETGYEVSFPDENGKLHFREVGRIYPDIDGEYVNLYYVDGNIETAMPMTKLHIWIIDAAVILGLYVLFGYRIYRIYRPKPRF